jgi:hypothetical protein
MGKLNFAAGDESPKLPLPSPGGSLTRSGSGSLEGGAVALFDMEFANGEFTESEKKKIMANERLAEIALTDPKRVKRCAFLHGLYWVNFSLFLKLGILTCGFLSGFWRIGSQQQGQRSAR